MAEPVTIGIGANKWIKEANTKMLTIHKPSNNASPESLHDSSGVDYQVPVGKKFIILRVMISDSYASLGNSTASLSQQFQSPLYYNTTTNSITGATKIYSSNGGFSKNYDNTSIRGSDKVVDDVYIEVAAGNYIIADPTHSNAVNVTGIETDV